MGFQRVSADMKAVAVNPEAGKQAMQWILDLFDKDQVSTRDVTDRYKAFGNGQGSIFWTGPWTLNGYVQQKLNFRTFLLPKIGAKRATYFSMGGLEMYRQSDESRYETTAAAIKWLSDNSLLWTTKGRGATPRRSIAAMPAYTQGGYPPELRQAFIDGLAFATEGEVPILAGSDFTIYSGDNVLAKTLEAVWAGSKSVDDAMSEIQASWQASLDKG